MASQISASNRKIVRAVEKTRSLTFSELWSELEKSVTFDTAFAFDQNLIFLFRLEEYSPLFLMTQRNRLV